MKCPECGAPRAPWWRDCAYCGAIFASVEKPPGATVAEDTAQWFERVNAHPETRRLLEDRNDLPEVLPRTMLRAFTPLIATGLMAIVVVARTWDNANSRTTGLFAAAAFVALGCFALHRGRQREQRLRAAPVEAVLARIGGDDGLDDDATPTWILELEGGKQRRVFPRPSAATDLQRGTGGVAWVRNNRLLRFTRLDPGE